MGAGHKEGWLKGIFKETKPQTYLVDKDGKKGQKIIHFILGRRRKGMAFKAVKVGCKEGGCKLLSV